MSPTPCHHINCNCRNAANFFQHFSSPPRLWYSACNNPRKERIKKYWTGVKHISDLSLCMINIETRMKILCFISNYHGLNRPTKNHSEAATRSTLQSEKASQDNPGLTRFKQFSEHRISTGVTIDCKTSMSSSSDSYLFYIKSLEILLRTEMKIEINPAPAH